MPADNRRKVGVLMNEPGEIALFVIGNVFYFGIGFLVLGRFLKRDASFISGRAAYVRINIVAFMLVIWPVLSLAMLVGRLAAPGGGKTEESKFHDH
jgi:hypothetical protein